ncbi:MAG: substrate-binding domain-containing protein [Clostridiales bacterium]|nr:substrate-binding domain-containing protein [Clostridiales bacterium]
MKKWQKTLAATIAASIALTCFLAGCKKSDSSKDTTKKTGKTTSVSETEEPTDTEPSETPDTSIDLSEFQFTEDNYPVIDGSTSTKPMATAITSIMLGIPRSEADDMLEFHKTSQSFSFLMEGEADLLICAEPAASVFETLEENNFEYEMEAFSAEALVFVVNVNNPVESLTTEQIQKIYTGEITNWKEVGGEDKEIVAVQRNETAGSQVMMENLVMGDLEMMEAPKELMPGDMSGLISVVKSYDNSAGAIGYTPYYYATNMKMADGLKILKVDDVMPDKDTIAKAEYPFRTSYYVVIPKSTPADAPARILYDWILSEEGQKLADMEGYVPASADPKGKSNVKVNVDWSSYQPAEAADPVYTRLKDEEITEFIPASDYGRIFPFDGSVSLSSYETISYKKGFFDLSGRIICDCIFDSAYLIAPDTYIVRQYIAASGDEDHDEVKVGLISADGSKFTGMKYCSMYRHEDGNISLIESTSDGIKIYPYDFASDELGTPSSYKVDLFSVGYFVSTDLSGIVKDKYLVFSDDEGDWCSQVIDGTTGTRVNFPDNIMMSDLVGNLIFAYEYTGSNTDVVVFDCTGKEVSRNKYSTGWDLDKDRILLCRNDGSGWDLADADGNVKASLENAKGDITDVDRMNGFIAVKKKTAFELYDLDLKLVKSVPMDSTDSYWYVYKADEYYHTRFASDYESDLFVYANINGKTSIMSLTSGVKTEIDSEYSVEVLAGYLHVFNNFGDTDDNNWKMLDSKTLKVVSEGKGYSEVFEDLKEKKYYLAVGDGFYSEKLSIVDALTGNTLSPDLLNPRNDYISLDYMYDGNPVYDTVHFMKETYNYHTSSTTMLDKDGNTLFLYNTVFLPED